MKRVFLALALVIVSGLYQFKAEAAESGISAVILYRSGEIANPLADSVNNLHILAARSNLRKLYSSVVVFDETLIPYSYFKWIIDGLLERKHVDLFILHEGKRFMFLDQPYKADEVAADLSGKLRFLYMLGSRDFREDYYTWAPRSFLTHKGGYTPLNSVFFFQFLSDFGRGEFITSAAYKGFYFAAGIVQLMHRYIPHNFEDVVKSLQPVFIGDDIDITGIVADEYTNIPPPSDTGTIGTLPELLPGLQPLNFNLSFNIILGVFGPKIFDMVAAITGNNGAKVEVSGRQFARIMSVFRTYMGFESNVMLEYLKKITLGRHGNGDVTLVFSFKKDFTLYITDNPGSMDIYKIDVKKDCSVLMKRHDPKQGLLQIKKIRGLLLYANLPGFDTVRLVKLELDALKGLAKVKLNVVSGDIVWFSKTIEVSIAGALGGLFPKIPGEE